MPRRPPAALWADGARTTSTGKRKPGRYAVSYTLTAFSLDIGGAERVLRRTIISDDALDAYLSAPGAALSSMLPVGGTRPDGFRITDGRARVRVYHTSPRRLRFGG